MTRMRRIGLASVVVAMGVFFLWGIGDVDRASAAKPGGTTHTSRIYYRQYSQAINYQMYEDGSNKSQVPLPAGVIANLSSKAYGGSHWWITTGVDVNTGFAELFAYDEDGNPPVQLTLAGPDVEFGLNELNVPRWSNDGQDRFVTFNVGTIAGGYLCRLWITDDDIAAIQLGASPFTGTDIEFVLLHPTGYVDYSWSNNDSMLAYLTSNRDNAGKLVFLIWVRALTDPPSDVPIYTRTDAEGAIGVTGGGNYFQWSPDGSRIAFSTHDRSTAAPGGVWTIKPDGTQPLQVKSNSGRMSYSSRGWSPDGTELLLLTVKARVGGWDGNLARMPAGGGTLITLTGDLTQTSSKTAVGWVPLSP